MNNHPQITRNFRPSNGPSFLSSLPKLTSTETANQLVSTTHKLQTFFVGNSCTQTNLQGKVKAAINYSHLANLELIVHNLVGQPQLSLQQILPTCTILLQVKIAMTGPHTKLLVTNSLARLLVMCMICMIASSPSTIAVSTQHEGGVAHIKCYKANMFSIEYS